MGRRSVVAARVWVALVGAVAAVVSSQPVVAHAAAASPSPSPVAQQPSSQPAAAEQPAAQGRPGIEQRDGRFDPARSKEVPTLTADQRQYDNPDGSHTMRMGAGPLKGQDAAGAVGDLDLSLVSGSDGRLRPRRASVPIAIAATSGQALATVELAPGKAVSLDPTGIAGGTAAQRTPGRLGETARYDRVLPQGTSLELRPLSSGIETTYVVATAAVAGGLTERLTLPAGYTARQGSGWIDLLDATGAVAGRWEGGTATDSSPQQVDAPVTLTLAGVSGQQVTANVAVDAGWLGSPARVYPVRVDPVIRKYTNQEFGSGATYVQTGPAGTAPSQWQGSELHMGTWDGGADVARTLVSYPISGIPANARIVQATMWVYETWSYSCQARGMLVHRITSAWDGGTVTWPSQPAFDPGTAGSASTAKGWSSSCAADWVAIDVTGLVGAWYLGQAARYGLMLAAADEADSYGWKKFAGAGTNANPMLDITYESYGTNPVQIDDTYKLPPATVGPGWQGMNLVNQGSDPWPANGPYRISYHVYSATGQLIDYDGVRTTIPSTVNPGGSIYLQAAIGALPMGDYILAWDMVQEGIAWFSSSGVAPVNRSYHSNQPPAQASLRSPSNPYVRIPAGVFGPYPSSGSTTAYAASFEVWFQTVAGGVILGQTDGVLPPGTPSGFVPALYVDAAGALRESLFWHTSAQNVAAGPYNDGRPHHVVATYEAGTDSLYVDGQLRASASASNSGYSGSYAYLVGTGYAAGWSGAPSSWFPFKGTLDEVAVYDKALTSARVGAHYAPGGAYKDAVLLDKPVAYYRLNDASRAPLAADSSGHGNVASWSGGVSTGVAGAVGDGSAAMGFDGSSGELDTAFLQAGVTAYGVEAWVKTTDGGANRAIVQDRGGDAGGGPGQSLTLGLNYSATSATGAGDPFFALDSNGVAIGVWSPRAINDGQWHHLVGTWAGTSGTAVAPAQFGLYVDGVAVTTNQLNTGSATAPLSGSGGTKIARHDAWRTYLSGSVDEVALYGKALSPAQVQNHHNASTGYRLAVLTDDPLAYYRLDDAASATTLVDASGHGVTASWTGGAGGGVAGLISGDADGAMGFGGRPATLTPTLQAASSDPDGPRLQYLFRICTGTDAESGQCADSGWVDSPSWVVPAGRLAWGTTYYWHAWVRDNSPGPFGQVGPPPAFAVTPTVPATREEWSYGVDPYASLRGGVNTATGGYTYANTDFVVPTVGPPLQVVRTYNSRDLYANPLGSWFGKGWRSTYEASVYFDPDGNATVTYPDGRRELLTTNRDGTWSPAFGFTSILSTAVVGSTAYYDLKHKDQSVWRFRGDGRVDSLRDPAGHVVQLTWNPTTAVIADQTSGRMLTVAFSAALTSGGRVTSITTSPVTVGGSQQPLKWTYTYDVGGQLASACDPTDTPGTRACTGYTNVGPGGRLTSVTLPNGNTLATLTYDVGSRVRTRKDGLNNTTTFDYAGSTTTVTDALGHTTRDSYNTLNQLLQHVDEDGSARSFTYDQGGFVNSITDENGSRTTYLNDPVANVTQVTDGAGGITYFSYDAKNNLSLARDARSSGPTDDTYKVARGYDAAGHLTSEQTPAGARSWAYTAGTEPAVGGGTTPAGLLLTATDAMGHVTSYAYDVAGNLRRRADPSGLVTEYTYDELGRQLTRKETSDTFPSGLTAGVAYDLAGRVITVTEPGAHNPVTGVIHQRSSALTYDRNGNLRSVTISDLTGGDASRRTTYDYDSDDRLTTTTDPLDHTRGRAYDAVGNVIKTTDQLNRTTQIDYTARSQVERVTLLGFVDDPVSPGAPRDVTLASYTYDAGGRTKTQTDALGRTRRIDYDGADRPTAVTLLAFHDVDGSTRDVLLETRAYDPAGHLTRRVEAGLRTTDMGYDPAGRLTTTAVYAPADGPAAARTVANAYDANGNVLSRTLSQAGADHTEQVRYHYDLDQPDRMDRVTVANDSPGDSVTGYTLDGRGLPTATTDPRGGVTNTTYDELGRLVGTVAPSVQVESGGSAPSTLRPVVAMGYDTFGELTQLADPRANLTTIAYDAAGRRTGVTYPTYVTPGGSTINASESWTYDAAGSVLRWTDRRGQATAFDYDMRNRAVRRTDPQVTGQGAAGVLRSTYDDAGNLTSLVDQVGARQEWTYDDLNRARTHTVVERVPAPTARLTWSYGRDDLGRLTSETTPLNEATAWQYDALGGLIQETDATSQVTQMTRDLADRPMTVTDPLGRKVLMGYDRAGHQTSETRKDAAGAVLSTQGWQHDLAGNVVGATDAAGHTTTYGYDALSRLSAITQTASASCTQTCMSVTLTTSFGYDASGNPTRVTDGNSHATVMAYNAYDARETLVEPSTAAQPAATDRTWTWTYDAGGLPTVEAQPGLTITSSFDELGRPTRRAGASTVSTYGWDLAGNLTSASGTAGSQTFAYDDRGLVVSASGIAGSSSFGYDADGRTTSRVDAAGTTAYSWTARSELRTASDPLTGVQQTLTYDAAGQLKRVDYGASGPVRDYAYDGLGQLTSDVVKRSAGGSVLYQSAYQYDANGNLKQKTLGAGQPGAGTQTYTYDWANRLTSWTAPSGAPTAYAWDAAGNRTQAGGVVATYDERNRLLTAGTDSYTWSPNGSLLTATAGGLQTTYTYDGLDRLTRAQTGSTTTNYVYDGLDRVARRNGAAFRYAGPTSKPSSDGIFTYSRTPGEGVLGLTDGTQPRLAAQGLHGDVELALNAAGTTTAISAYDPFGTPLTGSTQASSLGYQGEWTDPTTAQTWMSARWYDNTTGRFLTRDSIQPPLAAAVDANRYTYGRANPLGYVDPGGHTDCPTTPIVGWLCGILGGNPPDAPCTGPVCVFNPGPGDQPMDANAGGGGGAGEPPTGSSSQPGQGTPGAGGPRGGTAPGHRGPDLSHVPPPPYLPPPPGTRGVLKNNDPAPTSGVTTVAPVTGTQQAASTGCRLCTDLENLPTSAVQGVANLLDPLRRNPDTGLPDGLDKCLPRQDGSNLGQLAICNPPTDKALDPACAQRSIAGGRLQVGWVCGRIPALDDFPTRVLGAASGMTGNPEGAADLAIGKGAAGAAKEELAETAAGAEAKVGAEVALLGRPLPALDWSNIPHILERHWPDTATAGAGKFSRGMSGRELKELVETAIRYGDESPNLRRPGLVYEYEFRRAIGTTIRGGTSTAMRVVIEGTGLIRTAFPI